jgi:hypothetical protein
LNGGGGSGEPTTFEVVHGVRTDFAGTFALAGSADDAASQATSSNGAAHAAILK